MLAGIASQQSDIDITHVNNIENILHSFSHLQDTSEAVQLNYEQNMHDAMAVIHKLQTGLDVNVKFTGFVQATFSGISLRGFMMELLHR